jgi:hypothetical protein
MGSRVLCFDCFRLRKLQAGHKFHNDARNPQHDRALQFLVRPKKYNLNPHLVRQSTEVVA